MRTLRRNIWVAFLCYCLPLSVTAQSIFDGYYFTATFSQPAKRCSNGQEQICVTLQMLSQFDVYFGVTGIYIHTTFNEQALANPTYYPISFSSNENAIFSAADSTFSLYLLNPADWCLPPIVLFPTLQNIGIVCFDVIDNTQDIDLNIGDYSFVSFEDSGVALPPTSLHLIPNTLQFEGQADADFTTTQSNISSSSSDTLYVCRGQEIQFLNQSGNNNYYQWDFGDNHYSNHENPTHTYSNTGTYTVQLVADMISSTTSDCSNVLALTNDTFFSGWNPIIAPLENDFFPNDCYVLSVTAPQHGTVSLLENNTILYTSNTATLWEDSFQYIVYCPNTGCIDTATVFHQAYSCAPIIANSSIECDPLTGGYFVRLTFGGGDPACNGFGSYVSSCSTAIVSGNFVLEPGETTTTAVIASNANGDPFPPGSPPFSCTIQDGSGNMQTTTVSFPNTACANEGGQAEQRLFSSVETSSCTADTATMVIVVMDGIVPSLNCYNPLCAGSYETYSADAPCGIFDWSVTGGDIVSGGNGNSIIVHWGNGSEGTIHLEVSDCSGDLCNNSLDFTIPLIAPNTPIVGDTMVCANEVVTYNTPYYSGGIYEWYIFPPEAGVIISGQHSNTVSVQWAQNGQIHLYNTHSLLPCSAVNQQNVHIFSHMAANPNVASVCANETLTIELNVPLSVEHQVEVINGTILTVDTTLNKTYYHIAPANTNADSLFFTAYLTNNQSYCNDTVTISIPIIAAPPTPTAINGVSYICSDNMYTYQAEGISPGATPIWSVVGGTIVSGMDSHTVNIIFDDSGEYLVSIQQSIGNCVSDSLSIQPMLLTANNLQIEGSSDVCVNSIASYSTDPTLTATENLQWSINPPEAANIVSGQGTNSIEVQWNTLAITAELVLNYCNYSTSRNINIHALPTVAIEQTQLLCEGQSTTLNATDGFDNYLWNTNSISASIDITEAGVYNVTVSDGNGCEAAAAINVSAYPSPVAGISTTDFTYICTNDPHSVTLNTLLGDNYQYNWIKNGISTGFTNTALTHVPDTFSITTTYQMEITHAVTGCRTTSNPISIIQSPCDTNGEPCPTCPVQPDTTIVVTCTIPSGANAAFNIVDECSNPIVVHNESSSEAAYYKWYATGQSAITTTDVTENPTFTFDSPGYYYIRLAAFYENATAPPNFCGFSTSKNVKIPFKADFAAKNVCLGNNILFVDYSVHHYTTTITQYTWDFGDGTTSNELNPTHNYASVGTYDATLTITNDTCTQSITKSITVYAPAIIDLPDSLIVCQNSPINIPLDDTFIAANYDFGNGQTSDALSVSYTYPEAGNYNLSLTATDNNTCMTSNNVPVTVINAPVVSLVASDDSICVGQSTDIIAQSTENLSYLWSNGSTDSSISVADTNPYSLTVSNMDGCTALVNSPAISMMSLSNVSLSPATSSIYLCPNDIVNISAGTNHNNNYDYIWSNGSTYHSIQTQTVGNYAVTVTDNETACQFVSDTIRVIAAANPPQAHINGSELAICVGETATLTASHPTLSNFVWSNGSTNASITVSNGGIYSVEVTSPEGCTTTTDYPLSVYSPPNLSDFPAGCYSVCEGTVLSLSGTEGSQYQWYYNDAPIPNSNQTNIVLNQAGNYYVTANNALGCSTTSGTLSLEVVVCDSPLAISLLSFEGEIGTQGNTLSWITANEINNDYFTLQHSSDGQTTGYTDIQQLAASGNSHITKKYAYLHPVTTTGWHYYRLFATDTDGKTTLAGQIALYRQAADHTTTYSLSPNPTSGNIQVQFNSLQAGNVWLRCYDVAGRLVKQQQQTANIGNNQWTIDLGAYSRGMYYLQLQTPNGSWVERLVKQ